MSHEGLTPQHCTIGIITAWIVFLLEVVYAVTTVLGFLSLQSPQDPIGDPVFLIMELLIVLMAPLMVVVMIIVHTYAASENKIYSLAALIFMSLGADITTSVHVVILTVGRQIATTGWDWVPWFFSFEWPSVAYALDILAWDGFFALAMLCAAPVFQSGRLERTVRYLMVVSGVLSLAGWLGVPLADMQVRNLGILGYGLVAPVVFLLLGLVFRRRLLEMSS